MHVSDGFINEDLSTIGFGMSDEPLQCNIYENKRGIEQLPFVNHPGSECTNILLFLARNRVATDLPILYCIQIPVNEEQIDRYFVHSTCKQIASRLNLI